MAARPAPPPARAPRILRHLFVVYVLALVALPLAALVHAGLRQGPAAAWAQVTGDVSRDALGLTLWTSVLVGGINLLLGTATAWVLVRHRLPGRNVLAALVDLPLAIPTLVAGVMTAVLYGPTSLVGGTLQAWGVTIVFARPAILLVLLFVTLPLVVRAVMPLLAEIDAAEEEAAWTLGAGPWRVFRTVHLPAILPAALSGGIRSTARAMGEFGSIVVVAGNLPGRTLTAPVLIFGQIESGAPAAAAALSIALLAAALGLHGLAALLERRVGGFHAIP